MKATFCNLVFCVHLHLLVLELLGRWEVGWQTVSSKDMHWIEVFTSWLFMPDCYWLSFFKLYLLIWIFIDFHFWECILRRTTVDFSECQIWCYSKLHLYAICIQMHSSIRWQCYLGPIAVFCFGCVTCLNMIYFPSFSFMLLTDQLHKMWYQSSYILCASHYTNELWWSLGYALLIRWTNGVCVEGRRDGVTI